MDTMWVRTIWMDTMQIGAVQMGTEKYVWGQDIRYIMYGYSKDRYIMDGQMGTESMGT